MANGSYSRSRYGGGIYTPQSEQHDFGKDVLQAMMREKGMIDQREAQVMEFARQMNPVKFMHNELKLWQNDEINGLTDDISAKMREKKGRLTTDDLLNIQYQINEFRGEQQHLLGIQDVWSKEMAEYNDPKNAGVYSQQEMATRSLNWVTDHVAPKGGTFLVKNPKNFSIYIDNFNPIPKTNVNEIGVGGIVEDDPTQTRTITKEIYGAYTKESPYAGTKKDPLWVTPRSQALANELLYDDALMAGARVEYNELSQEEREYWDNTALTLRTTESRSDKDAQGRSVTFPDGMPLDGAYYWAVDQAYRVQPTTETDITKSTSSSLLPDTPDVDGDKTEAIEWAGVPNTIKRDRKPTDDSEIREVVYNSKDTATLTDVKLGDSAGAVRLKLEGGYFVTVAPNNPEWLGKSINDPLLAGERGVAYELADQPKIEKGMDVYTGDDIVVEGFVTVDMGRKKKWKMGNQDADMNFVSGMPIDAETKARLDELEGTNSNAKKVNSGISPKNVARIQLEMASGAGNNVEFMRVYDKDLYNELGTKFAEYEEAEKPKEKELKSGDVLKIPIGDWDEFKKENSDWKRISDDGGFVTVEIL